MPNDFDPTHLPNGWCNFTIAKILDLISIKFKEHVKFQDDSDADALALWVAMTYVMEHLEIAPMVYVTSPEPMCGKSTVMKLLKVFCHRAEMVSKITPAAIYRLIERDQPTLVFDEADRFLRGNNELNGIINAGHARFEATVIINKKLPDGNYEPIEFPVWCAKAIAGIGKQDDTLTSRSIVISLRRKLSDETVKPVRYNMYQQHEATRVALASWASSFNPICDNEMEPFLKAKTDRGTDNWLPLAFSPSVSIQNGYSVFRLP
jgi:putative DNA primase/helicase